MMIPYWNWQQKSSQVLKWLGEYHSEDFIKYAWPLIKNQIDDCQAYISSREIEISPYNTPIKKFGTFNTAKYRVLMSATTQEDTLFIKLLGFSKQSVMNPLVNTKQ